MPVFGGEEAVEAAAADSLVARLAQAKTAMMGGMWPTEASMRAYTDSKAQLPKAIADANVLLPAPPRSAARWRNTV